MVPYVTPISIRRRPHIIIDLRNIDIQALLAKNIQYNLYRSSPPFVSPLFSFVLFSGVVFAPLFLFLRDLRDLFIPCADLMCPHKKQFQALWPDLLLKNTVLSAKKTINKACF